MTLYELMLALRLRWLLAAAGLSVTLLASTFFATRPAVYEGVSTLRLYSPSYSQLNPASEQNSPSLVAMALVLNERLNKGNPQLHLASSNTSIYDIGLRNAVEVTVPASGNQWQWYYAEPNIRIEVVGSSPGWVVARQRVQIARAAHEMTAIQDRLAVRESRRIQLRTLQAIIEPTLVTGSLAQRIGGAAGVFLGGCGVTALVCLFAQRRAFRRQEEHREF